MLEAVLSGPRPAFRVSADPGGHGPCSSRCTLSSSSSLTWASASARTLLAMYRRRMRVAISGYSPTARSAWLPGLRKKNNSEFYPQFGPLKSQHYIDSSSEDSEFPTGVTIKLRCVTPPSHRMNQNDPKRASGVQNVHKGHHAWQPSSQRACRSMGQWFYYIKPCGSKWF